VKKVERNFCISIFITLLYWLSPIVAAAQTTIHRDEWYLSQPEESATIQMSGHESVEGAIAFIESLDLNGDIGYYQARFKKKPWFAVTYGLFNTLAEARAHLKSLPDELQLKAPWPRSFKVIQSLISVAEEQTKIVQTEENTVENSISSSTWEQGQAAYENDDFDTAFSIWQELAIQGDELSQFNLGVLYSRGEGTKLSKRKSIEWYIRSAEQGYAPAQFNLGAAYLEGGHKSPDTQKTASWWKMAAEQGFVQAQFNIASLYCRGIGVSRDVERCKFWYRRAASNGDILARKMLDRIQEREKEEELENGRKSSSEKENVVTTVAEKAMEPVIRGKKVERPGTLRKLTSQEQTLLRKAQAAFTRNKYIKSHDIWLPLAESGIAEAQYSLGFLYQSGWGPERDLQKAVAWYASAAEQNEARAQFNLGVILLNGEDDVQKNAETGLLWLTRSAKSKNARAKEFLIDIYSNGEYGIEVSKEKANYWKAR